MGGKQGILETLVKAAQHARLRFSQLPCAPWITGTRLVPVRQVVRSQERGGRHFRPYSHYFQGGQRRFFHHHGRGRRQCRGFSSGSCFFRKQAWIGQPFWRSNMNMPPKTSLRATVNRMGLNLFVRQKDNMANCEGRSTVQFRVGYARMAGMTSRVVLSYSRPVELLQHLWKPSQYSNGQNSGSLMFARNFYVGSYNPFANISGQQAWVKQQLNKLAAFAVPQDSSAEFAQQQQHLNPRNQATIVATPATAASFTLQQIHASEAEATSATQAAQAALISAETSTAPVETSVVDFDLKPHLSLSSVGELTEESIQSMSDDVEAFIKQLRDTMSDIKRMASLGELPVSIENGVVKVHFPNADTDKVHTLLSDVEVTHGVISDTTPEPDASTSSSSSMFSDSDDLLSNSVLSSSSGAGSYLEGMWGNELVPALTNATSEYLDSEVLIA